MNTYRITLDDNTYFNIKARDLDDAADLTAIILSEPLYGGVTVLRIEKL